MKKKHLVFQPKNGGQAYRFAGVEVCMKALKGETVGQWSLMEYTAPAHFAGPAPHFHKVMEEGFYVLEGVVTFSLDGEEKEAGPGSFVNVPPLTVHTFRNSTGQPIRLLVFMSPGGFEGYFDELQVLMENEPVWPPKDMAKVLHLLEKFDTYSPDRLVAAMAATGITSKLYQS